MNTLDCCLTLMLPKSIEETLVEHLLDHPEWVRGFSTLDASGHGAAGVAHTTAELVRGASRRVKVQVIMNREDAAALIDHLRATMTNAEVTYWLTPVLEVGRFE